MSEAETSPQGPPPGYTPGSINPQESSEKRGSAEGRMPGSGYNRGGEGSVPIDLEAERAVIGAMLISDQARLAVGEAVGAEDFYSEIHRILFSTIERMTQSGDEVDQLTLADALKSSEQFERIGGRQYLFVLIESCPTAQNVLRYASIVREKALLRNLCDAALVIHSDAQGYVEDVTEMLDAAEQKIYDISKRLAASSGAGADGSGHGLVPLERISPDALSHIQDLYEIGGKIVGVSSSFPDLDRMTSGYHPGDLIVLAARPSMGKCFGKGTPILMHDGSVKRVEDIVVGDELMGDDSEARVVRSLGRGREKMYWVRQNHAMDYRVNESHILSLKKSRVEGMYDRGSVVDITVRNYIEQSKKWKSNYKGYKVGVEYPEQEVPLDPYVLGLWIGDGSTHGARIHNPDHEIRDYLEAYAADRGIEVRVGDEERCPALLVTGGRAQAARGTSLQATLRGMGVLGDKHLPENYLINSREKRLELLAGLIDTDGHRNDAAGGNYEILQKSELLARQIKALCDGLGFRTSIVGKSGTIKSYGFEGWYYRVRFNGDTSDIPVRVERKKPRGWSCNRDWQVGGITLEADGVDDYYGFEVSGNNRRFLLEDGTVVHNTANALGTAFHAASQQNKAVAYFSLEMDQRQLVNRLIAQEARVSVSAVRTGQVAEEDWPRLVRAAASIAKAPLYIDDSAGTTVASIRGKLRRLDASLRSTHRTNEDAPEGVGLVVVDYLQLLIPDSSRRRASDNRQQEIAEISRSMKVMARDLDVPVILLSQLSREVERRADKHPMLSDLRDCLVADTKIAVDGGPPKRIADISLGDMVISATEDYQTTTQKVVGVWEAGIKPVFEMNTKTGHQITASANHRMLTPDGYRALEDLSPGDLVAAPINLPDSGITSHEDLCRFLGYMVGNGTYLKHRGIGLCMPEDSTFEDAVSIVSRHWPEVRMNEKNTNKPVREGDFSRTYGNGWGRPYGNPLREWFRELGIFGQSAHTKRVPEWVFEQGRSGAAQFVAGYLCADGSVKKAKGDVCFDSASRALLEDVRMLLGRIGVVASLRPQGRGLFRLNVARESIGVLAAWLRSKASSYKIELLWDLALTPSKGSNNGLLRLPKRASEEIASEVPSWRDQGRRMHRGAAQSLLLDAPEAERARLWAQSGLWWDEIESIEPAGGAQTYDIEVEGEHNFVADGLVVHNSGAIEQDADLVNFLYRDEYYNDDSEDTGIAEVIIAKHRNGPTGKVYLAWIDEEARFASLADQR